MEGKKHVLPKLTGVATKASVYTEWSIMRTVFA